MSSVTFTAIRNVSKGLHMRLASSGWNRKSLHLIRNYGEVIQGIHFQASQFGSAESGTFTVNLIVTEPRVYQAWCRRPLPTNPATASFPVQQRIGHFATRPRDQWWDVTAVTNLQAIETEIYELIQRAEESFFPQFPDLKSMLGRLREKGNLPGLFAGQQALVHGLIAAILGHKSEAERVLSELVATSKEVPGFVHNVREAAKNVGVII